MADAKKCDRCGRLYEIYDGIDFGDDRHKYAWLRIFTASSPCFNKTYELCPTCMTQVIAFLNNHKKFNTNNKPRCCKTCKYNNLGLDVCTGCTAGNYEMWEAKDNV